MSDYSNSLLERIAVSLEGIFRTLEDMNLRQRKHEPLLPDQEIANEADFPDRGMGDELPTPGGQDGPQA